MSGPKRNPIASEYSNPPGPVQGGKPGPGGTVTRLPVALHELTEVGSAARIREECADDLKYHRGSWFVFDGKRFAPDPEGEEAIKLAMTALLQRYNREAVQADKGRAAVAGIHTKKGQSPGDAIRDYRTRCSGFTYIRNVLMLARADMKQHFEFDEKPYLFNVQNGTIDLRTGELKPHDRKDNLTQICPLSFDASAECPRFDRFMEEILPDPEVRFWLQKFLGYSMIGEVKEHFAAMCIGVGRNGKGLLWKIIGKVMGNDYMQTAPDELLLKANFTPHPSRFEVLRKRRLIVATELPTSAGELDVDIVKKITGADIVQGRGMNKDFSPIHPTAKLAASVNQYPAMRKADPAFWARFAPIEFRARFDQDGRIDIHLEEKLKPELPGILLRLVGWCLVYQSDGLALPESMRETTSDVRDHQDPLSAWRRSWCIEGPKQTTFAPYSDLFDSFKLYLKENGQSESEEVTPKWFQNMLSSYGFMSKKRASVVWREGIKLTDEAMALLRQSKGERDKEAGF